MRLMRLLFGIMLLGTVVINAGVLAQDGDSLPITIVDATGAEITIDSLEAIASGSGDVTEIIVALGFRGNLVGIDISSTYPTDLLDDIQEIGFARRLAIEPIAAVTPTVFFCTEICTPTAVLDQVRDLDIPVVIIPDNDDAGMDLPAQKIRMVAAALGVPERGEELVARIEREIDWVTTALANVTDEDPYVLMIYVRGTRLQLVSGSEVPAYEMIIGAGAVDAAADIGVVGYTTLNAELILTSYPDIILLMEGGVESFGGLDAIYDIQGVSQTPAGENRNLVVMDDMYLLGMSTRTGQALLDLALLFHPSITWERHVSFPYTITDATGTEATVDQELTVVAANESLFNLIAELGYHPDSIDVLHEDSLIVATLDDDWEGWREAGYTVIVLEDGTDVMAVAGALGVPGRGEALMARQLQEAQ